MRALLTCAVLLSSTALASAGPSSPADAIFGLLESVATDGTAASGIAPAQFQFAQDGSFRSPGGFDEPQGATGVVEAKKRIYAVAADKKSAWVAADLAQWGYCGDCGMRSNDKVDAWAHGTMLVELGPTWRPLAWHEGYTVTDAAQAKALKQGVALPELPPQDAGDEEPVVELFMATLGDPAAMAKTVSDRKDVVLYGSNLPERYVGGAAVRAQLTKWGLAFKLRDGVHAGLTSSKTVAWVAANLDATIAKKPKSKPSPYRALFIYEKQGDAWRLVQAHFSFVVAK
jgi:hypothetical protein